MIWSLGFVALLVVSSGFRRLFFGFSLVGIATALLCALLVWIVGLDRAALAFRQLGDSTIAALERAQDHAYPERATRRAAAEQEEAACRELRGPDGSQKVRFRGRSCVEVLAERAEQAEAAKEEQFVQAPRAARTNSFAQDEGAGTFTPQPAAEPRLLTQAKYDRSRELLGTPGKDFSPGVLRRVLAALRRFAAAHGSARDVQIYSRLLVLLDAPDGATATRVALVLEYCQQRGLPAIVSDERDETPLYPNGTR